GVAPTKGVVTKGEELASHNGTTPTYVSVGETAVDDYGRTLDKKDAAGNIATTRYVETGGLTTQMTTTNALKHVTVTTVEPGLGKPTAIVDANSKRTDLKYDALGRLTDVWLPNRSRTANQTPSIKYAYTLRTDKTLVVKTEKLKNDGTYRASYELLDGLTRTRQTQQQGPDGGWLIGDFFYTGTGQVAKTNEPYHVLGVPGDQPIVVPEGEADGQTSYLYDGAGRTTAEIFSVAGDERWRTTTRHEGDRTQVDPPRGATPTTTVTDARGNTTEVHQYHGAGPTGAADVSRYTYTPDGQLASMTDAADNVWRYTYNQLRQKTKDADPDRGETTYDYDRMGRVEYVTNANKQKLKYVYDAIGRKTQTWEIKQSGDAKLAEWSFDGLAKGVLHWSARYAGGQPYGVTYSNLDALYRPGKTSYSIPSGAGTELAKTYDFTKVYNLDETVQSLGSPAAGGLPAEAVVTTYDDLLRPTGLSSGAGTYVTNTSYGRTGHLMRLELSTGNGKKAVQNWTYERGTGRLLTAKLDRPHATTVDADARYDYDEAGNVLAIRDVPAGGTRDIQCFTYDHLRRLTEAWSTANGNEAPCAGGPEVTGVGGPAAYHQSWELDEAGNRTSETLHGLGGVADTVRTYRYPGGGSVRPHGVTAVEETGPGGSRTQKYRYDSAGNTDCRPSGTAVNDCATGAGSQTLTWDAEGKLAAAGTTGFLYDADGARLLRKEPNATTVYLPGMELRLDLTTRKVTGTRSYAFGERTVATRTSAGVSFLAADHHGTAQSSVDATTGGITWRRSTPYGGPRGTQPSAWPNERGFVGGIVDAAAGLVQLGARFYDAGTGRFISVDPLLDSADPQQWNGYGYANNSPVSMHDASGLRNDPYSTPDGNTNDDGNLPDNKKGGGGGNNSDNDNPYGSDAEERASTGDPERAKEQRKKRYKQIKDGKFDFEYLFSEIDIDIQCKGGALARAACNWTEDWAENSELDRRVLEALDRIDESRTLNGNEFGFNKDDDFKVAFELAWNKMHVESRGDGRNKAPWEDFPAVGAKDNKGFDAYVDGVRSEFKYVRANTRTAIYDAFQKGRRQHATNLFIRVEGVDTQSVNAGMQNHIRSNTRNELQKIAVWGTTSSGKHWSAELQDISKNINCKGVDRFSCD
ncbi:MAG: RHS repeat-associated core domain-containing protein, partial [Actinoplanes sp.]